MKDSRKRESRLEEESRKSRSRVEQNTRSRAARRHSTLLYDLLPVGDRTLRARSASSPAAESMRRCSEHLSIPTRAEDMDCFIMFHMRQTEKVSIWW